MIPKEGKVDAPLQLVIYSEKKKREREIHVKAL